MTRSAGLTCPECGSPLAQEQHQGIQVDACDKCRGMWFDHGELEEYWRAFRTVEGPPPVDPAKFETDAESTTRVCPRCRSETLAIRRVDVFDGGPCSACFGVWLGPAAVDQAPREQARDSVGGGGLMYSAVDTALDLVFGILDGG